MVEKYISVRAKLDSKVFTPYGQSCTFISKSAPVYNSRGELESETNSTGTLVIVPYNYMGDKLSYQQFGDLNEGDFDAAVRYDTTIALNDEVVFKGDNYKVKEIAEEDLKEIVVKIIRFAKA